MDCIKLCKNKLSSIIFAGCNDVREFIDNNWENNVKGIFGIGIGREMYIS